MRIFQQNESVAVLRDVFVQMVDSSDHLTPKTGLTLTVEMVKAGGTGYAAATGAVVAEIGNGTYKVSLAAANLDTLGSAMLKITATGADDQYIPIEVVRWINEVHLVKAALVNKRTHTIDTGVDVVKDDNGTTTLRTLTPS